ncbi:lytic transglycosylase domain-containing protein [Salmonella enterica]|nr:lytic transglycosylase domain-containing protein [Salmonella enterica]
MIKETLLSLALQCAPSVHTDTVIDIAKTESGFNPFAIAEIVTKDKIISHLPKSKNEALEIIERLETNNGRFSVGLMQIYSGNFKGYNVTAEEMLNPCSNLKIAEKILVDCFQRGGNLKNALSCYYSGNFETGHKKETIFANTSYIERIGMSNTKAAPIKIIVPSTRTITEVNQPSGGVVAKNKVKKIIYPPYVLRGSVAYKFQGNSDHE